jgi:hypothetical protein
MTDTKEHAGMKFLNQTHFWGVVTLVVIVVGLVFDTTKAENDNFYSDIIRLDNVATRIHQNYVEDVKS